MKISIFVGSGYNQGTKHTPAIWSKVQSHHHHHHPIPAHSSAHLPSPSYLPRAPTQPPPSPETTHHPTPTRSRIRSRSRSQTQSRTRSRSCDGPAHDVAPFSASSFLQRPIHRRCRRFPSRPAGRRQAGRRCRDAASSWPEIAAPVGRRHGPGQRLRIIEMGRKGLRWGRGYGGSDEERGEGRCREGAIVELALLSSKTGIESRRTEVERWCRAWKPGVWSRKSGGGGESRDSLAVVEKMRKQ